MRNLHPTRLLPMLVLLLGATGLVRAAPELQSWQTENGAKVMFVQAGGLPMVDIRVVFDAGSAREGDHPGLAVFTNAMLTEGAGDWDADALAERLESRGIELGSGALRDMAWVSVRSLTEPDILKVAVETLAEVVASPRLADEDIQRIRAQMLVGLRQSEQKPGTLANRAFYAQLYGDHPYARDPAGTAESLPLIRGPQLLAFHQRFYAARNAVVAIVGDLDRASAEQLAEQVTAKLPAGSPAGSLPEPNGAHTAVVKKRFPSSQTHVLIGQPGVTREDPDYFPLYVGNHVLGGSGLVSLLGEEVRNKRGLSYSVYSYFAPMRQPGPFVMGAQTKNTQADEAIGVMRDTLRRFATEGPSEAQLTAAKQNLSGGFPLKVDSNKEIVQYIAMIGFYGLPLDWLDTLVDKIQAVTVAQVRDAFQRRIDPDDLLVVTVGDGDVADVAADAGAGTPSEEVY
jgi:zinc protease